MANANEGLSKAELAAMDRWFANVPVRHILDAKRRYGGRFMVIRGSLQNVSDKALQERLRALAEAHREDSPSARALAREIASRRLARCRGMHPSGPSAA